MYIHTIHNEKLYWLKCVYLRVKGNCYVEITDVRQLCIKHKTLTLVSLPQPSFFNPPTIAELMWQVTIEVKISQLAVLTVLTVLTVDPNVHTG